MGDMVAELALDAVKENYSLRGGSGEPFELRLHKVPIDEMSIATTFLAVQIEVNQRLQADGVTPWESQMKVLSAEREAPGAGRVGSVTERVAQVAHHLNEVLETTTGDPEETIETARLGSEDAILVEVLGHGLITVLWVNPRYLTASVPEVFEQSFNELLNRALAPLDGASKGADHG